MQNHGDIMVLRKIDLAAVGCYQAAWVLGGTYVGFIIQAMGADFYPRLTAVANDNPECNRLVNEQAEVGLLMAGPGVLATLTFAPLVIQLFYSAKFGPAVEILRWICLGMMLRVASWPMGFILIAKGERKLYFWTELLSNLLYLALVWAGMMIFGLKGTGMAFFGLYVVYWIGIYLIVRRLSGFRWSAANRRLAFLFVPLVAAVFVSWYFLPRVAAAILGVAHHVADRHLFVENTLHAGSAGTVSRAGAENDFIFPAGAVRTQTVEPPLHSILSQN